MNRVEVWLLEEETDIEETVNRYCERNHLNPISISVTYSERKDLWVVAAVMEMKGGVGE